MTAGLSAAALKDVVDYIQTMEPGEAQGVAICMTHGLSQIAQAAGPFITHATVLAQMPLIEQLQIRAATTPQPVSHECCKPFMAFLVQRSLRDLQAKLGGQP